MAPGGAHAIPLEVPEALVADCLLTAVLANPEGPLLPRLFRRLAAPLLWPRVDSLPAEDCFYQNKFKQVRFLVFIGNIMKLSRFSSLFGLLIFLSLIGFSPTSIEARVYHLTVSYLPA